MRMDLIDEGEVEVEIDWSWIVDEKVLKNGGIYVS